MVDWRKVSGGIRRNADDLPELVYQRSGMFVRASTGSILDEVQVARQVFLAYPFIKDLSTSGHLVASSHNQKLMIPAALSELQSVYH